MAQLIRFRIRSRRPLAIFAALLSVAILAGLTVGIEPASAATTTSLAAACGVNLRIGPSTGYANRTTIRAGTTLSAVATVTGGSWRSSCGGRTVSGTTWYRISVVNGRSVASLYGRSYLYAATGLFKPAARPSSSPTPVPAPTASPSPTPTPTPTPGPTSAPGPATSPALAAACDGVNLRTGPSTGYASMASVAAGTTVSVAAIVSGASWSTSCAGTPVSGSTWYQISAVNGLSVASAYGVSSLYGASGLFGAAAAPVPAPVAAPGASASTLGDSVVFYGRGWGHGVGLSQYGARGRALAGQSVGTILAHYYQGTTIGTMASATIRVLVLQDFVATAAAPLTVYGRGGAWSIDGIGAVFPADARLTVLPATTSGWQLVVEGPDGAVLWSGPFSGDTRIRPASDGTRLQVWSKPSSYDRYRGVIRIIAGTTVDVINELPLESYLSGVVPAEMPSSWPTEALKAQAIASRSYAAHQLRPGVSTFDVYDDTRSQVYLGSLDEQPTTDAAIVATAGQVLRSGSVIANALFHSTGGGATENNENVFVSSTGAKVAGAVSYLRGSSDRAPDGTSYDATSPYATWQTASYTPIQLAAIFGSDSRTNVGSLVALDLHDRGVSGRLISVTLVGSTGTTKTVSGDVFRAVFNAYKPSADPILRSNLFDLAPIP